MQSDYDNRPVYCFTAAGSIFEDFLAFIEIDDCLLMLLRTDIVHSLIVKFVNVIYEFL